MGLPGCKHIVVRLVLLQHAPHPLGIIGRMAFVRALLLRPRWLFLDEATSALDEDSEAMLYAMIFERLEGCAVISVAHRKSLVRYHDRQIVFSRQPDTGGAQIARIHYTSGPATAQTGALPAALYGLVPAATALLARAVPGEGLRTILRR